MKEKGIGCLEERYGKREAVFVLLIFFILLIPMKVQALPPMPTVDEEQRVIYANGFSLLLRPGRAEQTRVEYKTAEGHNELLDLEEDAPGVQHEKNLREWRIYGGARDEEVDSTNIFVQRAFVKEIYGGGDGGSVRGNTQIIFQGGSVKYLYGGGRGCVVKGDSRLIIEDILHAAVTEEMNGGDSADGEVGGKRLGYLQRTDRFDLLIKVNKASFTGLLISEKEKGGLRWRAMGEALLPKDETRFGGRSLSLKKGQILEVPEKGSLILEGSLTGSGTMIVNGELVAGGGSLGREMDLRYTNPTAADIEWETGGFVYTGEKIEPDFSFKSRKFEGVRGEFLCDSRGYKKEYLNNEKAGTAVLLLTKEGESCVIRKEFEIHKALTEFENSEGEQGLSSFNGDLPTLRFTYGDKITVKLKAIPSGRRGAAYSPPARNQLAVFVQKEDQLIQISEAQEALPGEAVQLICDTVKKELEIGRNRLAVKYIGTENMTDHQEEIEIELARKPLIARTDLRSSSSSKVYDGTGEFSDVELVLTGVLEGDFVSATANGRVADTSVGTHEFLISEAVLLKGESAAYYSLGKDRVSGKVRIVSAQPSPKIPVPTPPAEPSPEDPQEPSEEPETIDWISPENISADKVWQVRFNLPLDPETLTEENVRIEDAEGEGRFVPRTLEISEDRKSIRICPVRPFSHGGAYRLQVQRLRSEDGRRLIKNVRMLFRISAQ